MAEEANTQERPLKRQKLDEHGSSQITLLTPSEDLSHTEPAVQTSSTGSIGFTHTNTGPTQTLTDSTQNSEMIGSVAEYKCQLCRAARAKYKCPACSLVTCSLACCKEHKSKYNCTGKKPKSEFVVVPEMTDETLGRDFLFLEEVLQRQESRRNERKNLGMTDNKLKEATGMKWQLLQDNSKKFGIDLKYMPPFMKRRKKNTSCYITREDLILWRLEWIFDRIYPKQGVKAPMVVDNAKVRDVGTVGSLLNRIVVRPEFAANYRPYLSLEGNTENWIVLWQVKVKSAANSFESVDKYMQVPQQKTLREYLTGKTVYEFPTFHDIITEQEFAALHKDNNLNDTFNMTKPENGEEEGEAKAGSGAEEEAEEEGEDEEIGDEIVNALLSVISMDMIEGEKDEDEGEA